MRRFPLQTTALLSGGFRVLDPNTGRSAEASTRARALALLGGFQNFLSAARNGANMETGHVDRSAEARTPAGEDQFALAGQIEARTKAEIIERNASLAAREGEKPLHFISPSSEPISSPAETKAADAPPPASAATIRKPRTAADWRPHCLKPDACGSSKLAHCRTCAIAAGLLEVAA